MGTQTATPRRQGRTKAYAPAIDPATDEGARTTDESPLATPVFVDPATRNEMIAQAAYFRAERRGFAEGYALQDWLEAEAEIDAKLSG
jgi:hypothetical protein